MGDFWIIPAWDGWLVLLICELSIESCWPGLGPAADSLSLASPRESKQREGDPAVCDPYAALRGNLGCSFAGCAAELAARCALRSNNCGKLDVDAGVSCGTPATPRPARPRRIQKGWPRAIAALGTQGRARSASSAQAERSNGPLRTPHLYAPVTGCLRGGMRAAGHACFNI